MYRNLIFLLTVLALPAAPAFAGEKGEIRLDYRRESVDRPADVRPAVEALPRELLIEVEAESVREEKLPEKRSGGTVSTRPLRHGKLAEEARHAASWTVRELVENEGRREAYQMGFYDGLHTAMDDPGLGRWDYREGLARGRDSRDAERSGSDLGYEAAGESADVTARESVARVFHDLTREPRRDPRFPTPPMATDLREAPPPRLEEVFRDHPVRGYVNVTYTGPLPDPWAFYGHRNRHAVYDDGWWRTSRAFDFWASRHRGYFRDLGEEEEIYFKKVFRDEYLRKIAHVYTRVAQQAYRHGFDEGWGYGAHVVYDWNYRRGYHEGWHDAFRGSAETAFRQAFPRLYAERYDAYFDDWSANPRPEIRRVELFEENDDGIFEPGETVWVEYEIVNYGGAPGRFDVYLEGGVLETPARDYADLPRRAIRSSRRPLESVIDAGVAAHTRAELGFAVAGLEQRLPIEVSYPLELAERVLLVDHDSLAGRAVLETTVRNASRRPVAGQVVLRSGALRRPPAPRYFEEIGAGEERRVDFELSGLHPLDLLGGRLEVDFEATSHGRRHDEVHYRLPELALDLAERDLLLFMEGLARRERAAADEVRRAQELMLRRLRSDWEAVAADKGNRYKTDLKQKTRSTALGDLVWTYHAERGTFSRPEVFTALAPRIERLIETLPGTHPFLRKSAKKLVRQLEISSPWGDRGGRI